ncbi:carbamoyltransferase [bacterium]|nr:carbamoyltransferase [bacterium]
MTSYLLGINNTWHDTAACLIKDGVLIAAAEQERFDRTKHSLAFPSDVIDYCLDQAGIQLKDVNAIALPFQNWIALPHIAKHFLRYFPLTLVLVWDRFKNTFLSSASLNRNMKKRMTLSNLSREFPVFRLEHHLCHAASAFFVSPFEEAAILSIDGVGEWNSTLAARGSGHKITKLFEIGFPNSLGLIYQAVTQYLGFRPNCDESKVMGLSSYGDPQRYKKLFDEIIMLEENGQFRINPAYIRYHIYGHQQMLSRIFYSCFGPSRHRDELLTEHHQDLAAALQFRVEEAAIHLANRLHKMTGLPNLCLAGGVALNCVLNEKVKRQSPFEQLYVQPSANDAGGAIGSALFLHHQINNHPRSFVMEHVYWGPGFDDHTMEAALKKFNVPYQRCPDIARHTAQKITEGLTIGWFQGRMEIGPRALGNRSIVADPRQPNMKDLINQKVKHREDFRPFAPSVLEEHCATYFDSADRSPFMLQVYNVKPEWQPRIPAITHVDGTARVQTVSREINPRYYELIRNFGVLTGINLVLNTSFNDNNEPIVCTPEDAVRCYLKTGLDAMALGNYYCQKEEL